MCNRLATLENCGPAQERLQHPDEALASPSDAAEAKLEVTAVPDLLRALGVFLSQVGNIPFDDALRPLSFPLCEEAYTHPWSAWS